MNPLSQPIVDTCVEDVDNGFTAVSQSDYSSLVANRTDWPANDMLELSLKTFPGDFSAVTSHFTEEEWKNLAQLKVEDISRLASGTFVVRKSLCTWPYQETEDYQDVIEKFSSLPDTHACAVFCILSVVGRFVSSGYWSENQPWWEPSWLLDQLPMLPMREEVHQSVFSFEESYVDVPL